MTDDPLAVDLTMGYSPCPNDTFAFHALTVGRVGHPGLRFAVRLADVEALNRLAAAAVLDVTKLSIAALGHVGDTYGLLDSGAALGFGCGPLLVGRAGAPPVPPPDEPVAVPGLWTTAHLLLGLFLGRPGRVEAMPFDAILPAVAGGRVRYGVIIHEGRFTYPAYGLTCLRDLGSWWEETTGLPIPLGGMAVRRTLGPGVATAVEGVLRASVAYAQAHPDESADYVRRQAQELSAEVVRRHIDLYVNAFSLELGPVGRSAVTTLLERARVAGLCPAMSRSPFLRDVPSPPVG